MNNPTVLQPSKLVRNSRRLARPGQAQVDTMAASIQSLGMIVEPIQVRRVGNGYEIVDGEVRWLAALQLNLDIVPVEVILIDAQESAAATLMLNMERESIDPEEVVSNLERLVSEFGADAAEIVIERLPELRELAQAIPEFKDRIDAFLAVCKIDAQV